MLPFLSLLLGKRPQESALRKWPGFGFQQTHLLSWELKFFSSTPRKLRTTLGRNHLIT